MIDLLLFLTILIVYSIILHSSFEIKICDAIPITLMGIIAMLFSVGIVISLNVGFILVFFGAIIGIIYCAVKLKKNGNNPFDFFKIFNNKSFFFLCLIMILFVYCDRGMRAGSTSDDFTHWIYIVKEMVNINDFGTNKLSDAMFASYPPGMALAQYFIVKMHNVVNYEAGFSEWRCFLAYHMLITVVYIPFISRGNGIFRQLVTLFALIIAPTTFYMTYYNLSIEPALAVITGAAFSRIIIENDKDLGYDIYLWLSCFILTLLKDSGILFSIFIMGAYTVDVLQRQNTIKITRQTFKLTYCKCVICLGSIVFPKLMWRIHLEIRNTAFAFSQGVSLSTIFRVLVGKDASYRRQVLEEFVKAIFTRDISISNPWYDSDLLQPNWKSSYFVLAILLILVVMVINYLRCYIVVPSNVNSSDMGEYKKNNRIIFIFTILFIVYILGIGFAYISNFSEAEAKILAAFPRYIHVPYLALLILIILLGSDTVLAVDNKNIKAYKGSFIAVAMLAVSVIVISPRIYIYEYLGREYVKQSFERRAEYDSLSNMITDNCGPESKICFVNQNSWLYPFVTIRYNIRPIVMDEISYWGSWYISEATLEDNSCENFIEKISNEGFDYLAIYHADDYFSDTFRGVFDSEIVSNSLWKFNRNTFVFERIN